MKIGSAAADRAYEWERDRAYEEAHTNPEYCDRCEKGFENGEVECRDGIHAYCEPCQATIDADAAAEEADAQ